MGHILKLKDGTLHTILDNRDFEWLIEKYMGYEALSTYKEILSEKDDEIADLKSSKEETENYVLHTLLPAVDYVTDEQREEWAENFKAKQEDLYGIE